MLIGSNNGIMLQVKMLDHTKMYRVSTWYLIEFTLLATTKNHVASTEDDIHIHIYYVCRCICISTHILIHYKYESFYHILKDAHKLHVYMFRGISFA